MPNALAIQSAAFRAGFASKEEPKSGETFINPFTMSEEERIALIAKIRAGEVLELAFPARVFGNRPNANGIRPKPTKLKELVKRTEALPFLKNHGLWSVSNKIGHIRRSKMTTAEDGVEEVLDILVLTNPEAQEAFVRREVDEFSIQYAYETAECSKCGAETGRGWFGPVLVCKCNLGESYTDEESGEDRRVEIFTTGNRRLETSWVTLGAYDDTEILSEFSRSNESGVAFFGVAPINAAAPQSKEQGMKPKDGAVPAPAQESEKSNEATRFAELEERLRASEAREKAALDAAFSMAFDEAVKARKLGPAQRGVQQATFEKVFAQDITAYRAHLDTIPTNPAFGSTPLGGDSSSPSSSKPAPERDDMLLVKRLARHGMFAPETITPENIERVLGGLRFED